MRTEQPELFAYIQLAAGYATDLSAYGSGALLTYSILPKSHTQKPLTKGEIGAMKHTLAEHVVHKEQDGKQKAVIELSWFRDKIEKDSPIFIGWLQDSLKQIGSTNGKKGKLSFALGAIHVLMPFYMREEAREMEQTLFKKKRRG